MSASPSRKQLTDGQFEVDSVEVSPDGRTFYLQTSEAHPGERHLYAMSIDGGARTKLTTAVGNHGELGIDAMRSLQRRDF